VGTKETVSLIVHYHLQAQGDSVTYSTLSPAGTGRLSLTVHSHLQAQGDSVTHGHRKNIM